MHLSIIIPAFNEELLIEACLKSVHASLVANAKPDLTSEIIVVDNNSTDNTAELARRAGAQVVFEPVNQIGRARNTGAARATGDWLLFVDADSILNPELFGDILRLIEEGRIVGCGSAIKMQDLPWWASGVLRLWTATSVLFRWAAGALVVSRADAFRDVGGFDQELYAADEITLSEKLKKMGTAARPAIPDPDETSAGVLAAEGAALLRRRDFWPDCASHVEPSPLSAG